MQVAEQFLVELALRAAGLEGLGHLGGQGLDLDGLLACRSTGEEGAHIGS